MITPEVLREVQEKFVDPWWNRQAPAVEVCIRDQLSFLSEYQEYLPEQAREEIIAGELKKTEIDRKRGRLEGCYNDTRCEEPGITCYLCFELARPFIAEVRDSTAYGISKDQFEPVNESLWKLSLPKGVYSIDEGKIVICEKDSQDTDFRFLFQIDCQTVVRIEGDKDYLWQNGHYNWDGSPSPLNNFSNV